jgi:predicted nuclease of predicted toxin-antitoxin system
VPTRKRFGTRSAASSSRPLPERLTLFLDESLDATIVVEKLRETGAKVERLTDHFPKGTEDRIWLQFAGANGWIVLTRDQRIRYRPLELLALQASQVRAFIFTGGNVAMKETGEILAGALPRIQRLVEKAPGPFIYHIGRSGKPTRMV